MFDGAAAIEWIEAFCRIPKGPKVGQRVQLIDFQRDTLHGIFDTPTRRAIVSKGRQNAKTTEAAYLLLLHLAGPRHQRNGLLVSSALTREQAAILFDTASQIIRLSPELSATIDVIEFTKTLRCRELGTTYRALSADALPQLGLSPYFVVYDELGAVQGPYSKLYDVLESGSAVQTDPLSIIISTQARSDSDLLSRLIDDAATGADPCVKLFLWTAPPDADPFDEQTWRLANPALGHFLEVSILNIRLRGDYALIAVDTGAVMPDGSLLELSKLAPLIHIPAVIGYRGTSPFMPLVFMRCVMKAGRDLENLLDDVPTILPAAFEQLLAWEAQGLPQHSDAPIDKQMIALVGWSRKQEKMIGRIWEQADRAAGFIATDITTVHIGPWHQSIAHLDEPFVAADMERLARAQVQLMRDKTPALVTGGRLFVASLDRKGTISIRPQCNLDDQPAATVAGSPQSRLACGAVVLGAAAA